MPVIDRRAFEFLRELAAGEGVTVRVRGDCMEPLIAAGAEVRVTRKRVYLPGDVIVFRTPSGELAAHRLLGYRASGLVTKGDHCVQHDAPVTRSMVIGAIAGLTVHRRDRLRAIAGLGRIILRRLKR
ncbi:MAG TPA: S24/S26 family peptidase [Thermoanaerobaculia bacterium]